MTRKVRISVPLDNGTAGDQIERLGRAAGRAADSTEKLQKAADKKAEQEEKDREKLRDSAVDASRRIAIEGAGQGAIRALGQSGAGGTDAFFAGIRGLQAGLPALGATLGAASPLGPVAGSLAGGAAGTAAAAALERQFGPEAQAREEAIAATTATFASAAAQGVPITREEYQEVFTQAFILAMRARDNERGSREAANPRW